MKRTSLCLSLLTLCAVVSISPNASAVPGQVAYTGYLQKTVAGKLVPYTGSIPDITFNLHETLTGGASQWQETVYNVNVDNGVFFVVLGKKISPGPRLRSGLGRGNPGIHYRLCHCVRRCAFRASLRWHRDC